MSMNKSEWIDLARVMYQFSETNKGRISLLIKELIYKVNTNMEVILDDVGRTE